MPDLESLEELSSEPPQMIKGHELLGDTPAAGMDKEGLSKWRGMCHPFLLSCSKV